MARRRPTGKRRTNRGPAVAAANRAALVEAARRVFSQRGYHAPFSAIAREAGVGQAVLYRHFPTKLDLAFAVFEEHFREYEAVAARKAPEDFFRLWRKLVENVVDESAFIDMVVDARRKHPAYDGDRRLARLLAGPIARAQEAGLLAPSVTLGEVALAIRMAYGVVITSPDSVTRNALLRTVLAAFPRLAPERG